MTQILHDSTDRLNFTTDKAGKITEGTIETFQHIPDNFLRELADQKHFQDGKFAPDEIKVASVPGAVVDKWIREGFNIMSDRNITPAMIVARLKAEDLSRFVTTSKIG